MQCGWALAVTTKTGRSVIVGDGRNIGGPEQRITSPNGATMTQNAVTVRGRTAADRYAQLVIVLMCCAAVVIGFLTVTLRRRVDPVSDPVSDYVFYGPGEPLFVIAVLLMICGGVALTAGMAGVGMPSGRSARVLLGLWAAGLLVCAVFPANRIASDPTVSGELHRFGGALLFTCLPLAGRHLARSLHNHPQWTFAAARIRRFAAAAVVTAAAFGVAQLEPWLPQGLLERFALGTEFAMLIVLALIVRRAAR